MRRLWFAPTAAVVTPFFVAQFAPARWDYWPQDEARRQPTEYFRLFMPQTPLAPWRQAEFRQQQGAEEYRRVSDDGWSIFRPYWTPPPSGVAFFMRQQQARPWDYWPGDEGRRQPTEQFRLFMPQTKLTPMVASQAETRQQWGAEEFRRVSDDGWSQFRFYWAPVIPVPPSSTTTNYWQVGPKGIKTRITFIYGMDRDQEQT